MNENLQETISPLSSSAPDLAPDLSPEPSYPGNVTSESNTPDGEILTSTPDPVYSMVSSGDLENIYTNQKNMQAQLTVLQDTAADTITYLEKINYTLTAIFWLLLFAFCFKRIRSGVKGFTGRGLDE